MKSAFTEYNNPEAIAAVLSEELGFRVLPKDIRYPVKQGAQAFTIYAGNIVAKFLIKDNSCCPPELFRREQAILSALAHDPGRLGVTIPALLHEGEYVFAMTHIPKPALNKIIKPGLSHQPLPDWVINKLSNFLVGFDVLLAEKLPIPTVAWKPNIPPFSGDLPDFASALGPLLRAAEAELTAPRSVKNRFVYPDLKISENIFVVPETQSVSIVDFGSMTFGDPHYPLMVAPVGSANLQRLVKETNRLSLSGSRADPWDLDMNRIIALSVLHVAAEARYYDQNGIMKGRDNIKQKIAYVQRLNNLALVP